MECFCGSQGHNPHGNGSWLNWWGKPPLTSPQESMGMIEAIKQHAIDHGYAQCRALDDKAFASFEQGRSNASLYKERAQLRKGS